MMRETFVNLLDQYPGLRPFLVKICERYHKKGTLTGTLKLGQGLEPQELSALHSLFGMQAISVSRFDAVSLSFDRFFRGMAPEEREAWIDGVHACLNTHRTDALQEKRVEQEDLKRLFERLQLAYPKLHGVHQVLPQQLSENRSFTQDLQDLYFKAAEITSFLLQNNDLLTFSELGARFLKDSKALRDTSLSRLIASWLMFMEEDSTGGWQESETAIWERYHVVRDRLAVQASIFGPLVYEKNGQRFDWIYKLWQSGEPATLSWPNIFHMDRMVLVDDVAGEKNLITCENESPFTRMIRDGHYGILLYTSGFPNDAVLSLYRHLAPQTTCLHWGDTDLAGLRIAAILHGQFPLRLWRCDLSSLRKHSNHLIALKENQGHEIELFLLKHPDFPFAKELSFTLESGWLEQEGWQYT